MTHFANSTETSRLDFPKRARVALTIHSLQGGGAERLMAQLANHWASAREVHLITWSATETDQYQLDPQVLRHGLALQSNSPSSLRGLLANIQRVRRLRATIANIRPEIIISFCDQMNIVCLEAARNLKKCPVWIAEHSHPLHQKLSPIWEAWRRRSYPQSAGAIALTDEIRDIMGMWIPKQRIRIIPPALCAEAGFHSEYQETARDGCNTITFVGRLSQEKQVAHLLKAWSRVHRELAGWRLQIVGDGPERANLELLAKGLPRVDFAGWSNEPQSFLRQSQLFVLPSRYEGFPLALLEALSFGLPCIVTRCSAAIEKLAEEGGPNSLRVVEDSSAQSLASAISELALDVELRRTMSMDAKKLAQRYRWQVIASMWDAVINA